MIRSDSPSKTRAAKTEVGYKDCGAYSIALTLYVSIKLLPQQLQRTNKTPTYEGLTVEGVEAEAAPGVDEVEVKEVEFHLLFVEE